MRHSPPELEAMDAAVKMHAVVRAFMRLLIQQGWTEAQLNALAKEAILAEYADQHALPVLNGRNP